MAVLQTRLEVLEALLSLFSSVEDSLSAAHAQQRFASSVARFGSVLVLVFGVEKGHSLSVSSWPALQYFLFMVDILPRLTSIMYSLAVAEILFDS